MSRKATQVNVYLPEDLEKRVEKVAKKKGLSKSALIRLAVSEWIESREGKGG